MLLNFDPGAIAGHGGSSGLRPGGDDQPVCGGQRLEPGSLGRPGAAASAGTIAPGHREGRATKGRSHAARVSGVSTNSRAGRTSMRARWKRALVLLRCGAREVIAGVAASGVFRPRPPWVWKRRPATRPACRRWRRCWSARCRWAKPAPCWND